MKLLHIDSSIMGDNSVSRGLGQQAVSQLQADMPALEVTYYDLAAQPIPHLSGELFAAQVLPAEQRNAEQQENVALSEKLMADFLAADMLVIGAPMYNFGLPSQLKAWIDRIAVAGKTFRYTANGPEGLAGGKRAIIVSSRGSAFSNGPLVGMDHQEAHLKTVLGFLGITDVTVIRAEGLAISPDSRKAALDLARTTIATLGPGRAA